MKIKYPFILVLAFILVPLVSSAQVHLVTSGFNTAGGNAIENQSFDFSLGEVISSSLETSNIQGNIGILQVIPDNMTGVNIERLSQISIYPNPSLGVFEILSVEEENYSYRIFNADGSLKEEGKHIGYRHTIDLSEYAPGVYLLSISNGMKLENFKLLKL